VRRSVDDGLAASQPSSPEATRRARDGRRASGETGCERDATKNDVNGMMQYLYTVREDQQQPLDDCGALVSMETVSGR